MLLRLPCTAMNLLNRSHLGGGQGAHQSPVASGSAQRGVSAERVGSQFRGCPPVTCPLQSQPETYHRDLNLPGRGCNPPGTRGRFHKQGSLFFPRESRGEAWTSSTKFPELLRRAGCPGPPQRATAEQETLQHATGFPLHPSAEAGTFPQQSPTPQAGLSHFPARIPASLLSSIPAPEALGVPQVSLDLPGSPLPQGSGPVLLGIRPVSAMAPLPVLWASASPGGTTSRGVPADIDSLLTQDTKFTHFQIQGPPSFRLSQSQSHHFPFLLLQLRERGT